MGKIVIQKGCHCDPPEAGKQSLTIFELSLNQKTGAALEGIPLPLLGIRMTDWGITSNNG